jgi:hypothetical protein
VISEMAAGTFSGHQALSDRGWWHWDDRFHF